MSRSDWVLVEGSDHNFYPVTISAETVVWNMKYDSYSEYAGQPLEDDEKLVEMTVAR